MENKKNRTESTIKKYKDILKYMKKNGCDISDITMDELAKYFEKNELGLSSQGTIYSALIWKYENEEDKEKIKKKFRKEIKKITKLLKKRFGDGGLSKKEEINYVQWKYILYIYSKLKMLFDANNGMIDNMDFAILSVYILHPVRRLADYVGMVIDDDQEIYKNPECIFWMNEDTIQKYGDFNYDIKKMKSYGRKHTEKINYYVRNNDRSYFVFNSYKTFGNYKRQIIEIHADLDATLKEYIKRTNKKNGDKLFDIEKVALSKRLNAIFEKTIGKTISVNILRHSFISDVVFPIKVYNKKKKISYLMGHSFETQNQYIKADVKEIDYTNIIDEKMDKFLNGDEKFNRKKTEIEKKETRKLRNLRYYEKKKLMEAKNKAVE